MNSSVGATTVSSTGLGAGLSAERHAASARAGHDAAKLRAREAMLHGPITPTLMRMALPTIAVLVAQTVVNVAETYYVSLLGTGALIGVALVFPVWMLMTMMAAGGVGSGVASAVARAAGAGRHDDADALVFHALVIAIVLGLVFSIAVLTLGASLFRALGGSGAALHSALLYSGFIFLGAVPIWVVNLMSAALRGIGNVRIPALVTLLGAIILVPLSPGLIFGVGSWRGFGVAGAGVAVTLYYCAASVAMIRYMVSGRSGLRLSIGRLRWDLLRAILGVGTFSALNTIQLNLLVVLVTGAVGEFGVAAIGGYGTASRLDYVLIPILFGLGTAVLTMVGVNVGAGSLVRARRIAWIGTAIGATFTEFVGLAVALFPALWIGLFSHQQQIMETGTLYLRVVGPSYAANGIVFCLNFAAQGSGRVLWPFLAGAMRLAIAGGGGWIAVSALHVSAPVLFAIVAASSISGALVCVAADLSGSLWRTRL